MLGDSLLSSATFPRGGRHFRDLSVDRASNKAWVGIALHQRVDLQLGFVERRRGWTRDHVLVNNVTYSRIQRNLIKIRFFFTLGAQRNEEKYITYLPRNLMKFAVSIKAVSCHMERTSRVAVLDSLTIN